MIIKVVVVQTVQCKLESAAHWKRKSFQKNLNIDSFVRRKAQSPNEMGICNFLQTKKPQRKLKTLMLRVVTK